MEFLNFPIVALGAALICLIGITIYAITQRGSLRSRDEQLVVARAQAYAMLELRQAGVLFLDREHKLMGEASAAAPELLGHTCGAGTAFVQVDRRAGRRQLRREAVAYLESMWQAEPTAVVDATQNPLQGALRFAPSGDPLLAPGGRRPRASHHRVDRAHFRAAHGAAHHRSAGARRRYLRASGSPAKPARARRSTVAATRPRIPEAIAAERRYRGHSPVPAAPADCPAAAATVAADPRLRRVGPLAHVSTGEFAARRLDVTDDSIPAAPALNAALEARLNAPTPANVRSPTAKYSSAANAARSAGTPRTGVRKMRQSPGHHDHFARVTAQARARPKPAAPIRRVDHRSARSAPHRSAEGSHARRGCDAREVPRRGARQGRPAARHHQTTGTRAAGLPRKAGADPRADPRHQRARRAPAAALGVRARGALRSGAQQPARQAHAVGQRFPAARGEARRPAEPSRHPGRSGHAPARMAHAERRVRPPSIEATQRSATATGTTIRQPQLRDAERRRSRTIRTGLGDAEGRAPLRSFAGEPRGDGAVPRRHVLQARVAGGASASRTCRATIAASSRRSSASSFTTRSGTASKPRPIAWCRTSPRSARSPCSSSASAPDGYQLSVQDDGRGLDHDKIRAEAVRQGVLTRRRRRRRSIRASSPA